MEATAGESIADGSTPSYNVFQSYFQNVNQLRICLLIILITTAYILYTRNKRKHFNLPPGPPRLPLLGSIPWIHLDDPTKSFSEWADKYGGIVTYYIGSKKYLIVNDAKLARELLVKRGEVFSSRGPMPAGEKNWGIKGSIFFENGDDWKTHRRWTITGLRHFGVGKRSLDKQLDTEARNLCQEIWKFGGVKFNPAQLLTSAVSNVICSISFGKRYEYDDPEFQRLLKNVNEFFQYSHVSKLEEFLQFLLYFFVSRRNQIDMIIEFFNSHLQHHKETFDENNIRDLIDMLLLQGKEDAGKVENETGIKPEQGTSIYKGGKMVSDDIDCLWRAILIIFLAGTDGTACTISWFLLYMVSYPDVQKRIHDEIDAATDGGTRSLTPLDKLNVPYFEATILEVQRLGNVAPLGVPHRTLKDSVVNGYDIPANTTIIFHLQYIHTDPKYWKDPSVFKPERFMDVDETKVIKRDCFMPFGIGRRNCMGEMLAKMELYATLSCLLQRFVFELPESGPRPSFETIIGISQKPVPFELIAKPRQNIPLD